MYTTMALRPESSDRTYAGRRAPCNRGPKESVKLLMNVKHFRWKPTTRFQNAHFHSLSRDSDFVIVTIRLIGSHCTRARVRPLPEHQVGHHCSLSPGGRTLWPLTPFGSARQPDSLSLSIRSHSPPLPPPPPAPAPPVPRRRHPRLQPRRLAGLRLRPTPRCTLLHQPSLPRPPASSPSRRQVRVDLGPALNRPSLQPPLTPAIPRPLVPCFSTPAAAAAADDDDDDDDDEDDDDDDDDDGFSARRRTLIPISKIRLPSKSPYRLARASPESAT